MKTLIEILGWITFGCIIIAGITLTYRAVFPKEYNESNCPNDHDTMCRSGASGCDRCGTQFWGADEEY